MGTLEETWLEVDFFFFRNIIFNERSKNLLSYT